MTTRNPDDPLNKALARYQVIAAYIAESPRRGARRALLEKLAARTWVGADGEPLVVRAETIRAWTRRYRKGGLDALRDKPRPRRGVRVLDAATVELICKLKREVPERSLDRMITIAEDLSLVPIDTLRRSTLHRVLFAAGISARKIQTPDTHDLDRFEADAPNDLWQSDMLEGPWLPDPERPGHVRRAWLYAFLDDHSRRLLHGRFSFKGDLPALELVFRRALQKYGVPKRVYYDNGAVYRSHHMRTIVGEIGTDGLAFTKVRRPMGHGKIEALNRLMTSAFIAEAQKASTITTLEALNEAFVAWMDLVYNDEVHGETHEKPLARWDAGRANIKSVDEEKLRKAFLWRETRKPDKSGVFSLFSVEYQVGPALARRAIDVRYDPEDFAQIEVWYDEKFVERLKPFHVKTHRRAVAKDVHESRPAEPNAKPPVADWLGHLVKKRRLAVHGDEPSARQIKEADAARRKAVDEAVVSLLAASLDPDARDDAAVRAFLDRHGPFDVDAVSTALAALLASGPKDHHPTVYLDAIHRQLGGRK